MSLYFAPDMVKTGQARTSLDAKDVRWWNFMANKVFGTLQISDK
jgi:hypothetical protein